MRRRHLVCLAAAALALLTAGAGQAAAPQESRTEATGTKAPAVATADDGRSFPFSGLDIALLTAGGGPLLLIGVSLRRRQSAPKVKPAQEDSLTLA
jgi:hypothetical protein